MTSDEMRELLSAYFDGELREADRARVDAMLRESPDLAREVADLARLRAALQAWDREEGSPPPPPTVRQRALARARSFRESEAAGGGRGRIPWLTPARAAAALFLGAGVGLAAGALLEPPPPEVVGDPVEIARGPVEPLPAVAPPSFSGRARLEDDPSVALAREAWRRVSLRDAFERRALGEYRDGQFWDGDSYRTFRRMEAEREMLLRRGARGGDSAAAESRTDAWNREAMALVAPFRASEATHEGLVVIAREAGRSAGARAMAPDLARFLDPAQDPGRLLVRNEEDHPVLLLLGEVLVANDRSRRARVVAADTWVGPRQDAVVPVAWADSVERPAERPGNLALRDFVLGPSLRRRLVGASGRSESLRAAVAEALQGRKLPDEFAPRPSEPEIAAALAALRARGGSLAGFAVAAEGRVRGIELFADEQLAREFAARLLRGYARETGKARAPSATEIAGETSRILDELSARVLRVAKTEREPLPDGTPLAEVTLLGPGDRPIAYGLLLGGEVVHLTVFAE
jgi:hypothetical protein